MIQNKELQRENQFQAVMDSYGQLWTVMDSWECKKKLDLFTVFLLSNK